MPELTNEYISSEVEKLRYPYGLSRVIRFNLTRKETSQTQSVAEHVTNMIFLAYYFRKYEDPKNKLDFDKVIRLIITHDMGEIETGDVMTVVKSDDNKQAEKLAIQLVKKKSPEFIAKEIEALYEEFENPMTREGQYSRAIDKFEGQLSWIEKEEVEMVVRSHRAAGVETRIVHPIHMKKVYKMLDDYNFPTIKKFVDFLEEKKYGYRII